MMARPTPVLPEVGSTIVPPGRSSPDSSAASIMRSAMRSLTEPPGLKYSILARTVGVRAADTGPAVTLRSRTSGVLPINSISDSYTRTATPLSSATFVFLTLAHLGGPWGRACPGSVARPAAGGGGTEKNERGYASAGEPVITERHRGGL